MPTGGLRQIWRWWSERSVKGNFYRKSLVLVLIITSLPTALIGIGTYVLGRAHIEQEVNRSHQVLLGKALDRLNDDLTQLELTATQWSIDPRFDEKLRDINLKDEYNIAQDLFRSLSVMKGAYPLIDQVHLYLDRSAVVVSDVEGIVTIDKEQEREQYHALLEQKNVAFWLDQFPRIHNKGEPPVTLVHRLPGIGQPFGALIIYLDQAKLIKMVQELSSEESGASFVLGKDGRVIVDGGAERSAATIALEQALRSEVIRRNKDSEAFLFSWNGETYSVSYGQFTRLGLPWKYVTSTPLNQLTAPVVIMSRLILAMSGAGLLIALILSWLASRNLYKPIRRLVGTFQSVHPAPEYGMDEIEYIEKQWQHITRESRLMQAELEKAQPNLRESFLLQLVQGHFQSLQEQELRERLGSLGWDTDGLGFVLLLVQLTGFSNPEGRFGENDGPLVTFAAANIVQEITDAYGRQAAVFNFQDMTVGVLLTYPLELPRDQEKIQLFRVAREWISMLGQLLKLQVTVGVSRLSPNLKDVPLLLQDVRQAVRYRDLHTDGQVLDMEELLPSRSEKVDYPFDLEREVVQAVRMGMDEEAGEKIEAFIGVLVTQAGKEKFVQEGVQQLLGSIHHAILESGYHPHSLYGGANLYEQLSQIREPEMMVKWFRTKVIAPYMNQLASDQTNHWRQLVERAIAYLRDNYSTEVSLEQCAALLGVSTFTLSRAFKQVTGVNYIDFVTRQRVKIAKELLRDTDLKICDIASRIGYQPSYLIRLFKKYEGMTPGQYRER
jgi:AraC-like DNA-binding protein